VAQQLTMDWLGVSREALKRQREGVLADLPRARTTDPETSHEAAAKVLASGQLRESQRITLDAVTSRPGSTAVELAAALAGTPCRGLARDRSWWRFELSRRLPELVPVHVRRGKPRECRVSGSCQTTWYPVKGDRS
jgi:hypothetical protein